MFVWGSGVVLAGAWVAGLTQGATPASFLSLVPATLMVASMLLTRMQPYRVELRGTELVLRYLLHARRIPYTSIRSVHGDVPARLDWSTRVQLELRDGKRVTLPVVEASLAEVHRLISQRVGPQ